jgi:hypothetical protein
VLVSTALLFCLRTIAKQPHSYVFLQIFELRAPTVISAVGIPNTALRLLPPEGQKLWPEPLKWLQVRAIPWQSLREFRFASFFYIVLREAIAMRA